MSADSESDFKSVLHAKGGEGGAVQFNCSVLVQVVLQRSSNAIGWDLE